MSDHVKPTKEELQAKADAALKELEEWKDDPIVEPEDKKETPNDTPEEKEEEIKEDVEEKVIEDKKEVEDIKEEENKEDVDYRKKFANSTREAQILADKQRKMAEAYDKANTLPEPTEEELRQEFPEWDTLDETAKKLAIKTLHNDKRFAVIETVQKEFKDIEAWKTKVDTFIDNPETLIANPELENKEEDFKIFANKQSRMGTSFDTLVSAFLYDVNKNTVKHKGKMFEDGGGGSKERKQPISDILSVEQGRALRLADYKKWTEYLRAGKIATE